MNKSYIGIAAILAMLAVSRMAIADSQGPVTIVAIQPAQSSTGCAYFQVNGGAHDAWTAIDSADAAFNSQMGMLMGAYFSGTPIVFDIDGTACNYPKMSWVYLGTLN